MQTKLKGFISATLTVALAAAPFSASAFAAANEITTVSFAAERQLDSNVNTSFTVTVPNTTPDSTLSVGDVVAVRIPDAMQVTGTPVGGTDFTMTSNGTLAGGTYAYDATSREVSYTLDANDAVAEGETLTVTFANTAVIKTPANTDSNSGTYAFAVRLVSATGEGSDVLATGAAILAVNNTVSVTTTVQEALILNISDTSVNLNIDPSVNNGKDYSQSSVLTVKTNAKSGYTIQAQLNGTDNAGSAVLDNTTTTDTIAAGDAVSTENKFGYVAYNNSNDQTKTQATLEAVGATQAFAATPSTLVAADASNVAYNNVTNSRQHTVYYGANVDYLTPAGSYTGVITYTAVPAF